MRRFTRHGGPRIQVSLVDDSLMPSAVYPGDAGLDLRSSIDFRLEAGERIVVTTGVRLLLPQGYVGLVCPRSGLAAKQGVTVLNAPGVIDPSYRGEVKVVLMNLDSEAAYKCSRGDRIAQLVVQQVERARFHQVTELPDSRRGTGGHGSTGGFGLQQQEAAQ